MFQTLQLFSSRSRRTLLYLLSTGFVLAFLYCLYNRKSETVNENVLNRLPSSAPSQRKTVNVVCFGDSLTEGMISHDTWDFHPYSTKLQKLLNSSRRTGKVTRSTVYKVYNQGKSGERVIGEMTKRLPHVLKGKYSDSRKYDWVIILGGTNDLHVTLQSGNYELKHRIFEALVSLHRAAHRRGARTLAVTIPARKCELKAKCKKVKMARLHINKSLKDYAKQLGTKKVIVVDLAKKMRLKKMTKYWSNEVHFTPAGYDKMAAVIFDTLNKYL